MTEQQLKIGDVVYLKSGSPAMTITALLDGEMMIYGGHFLCVWTDNTGKPYEKSFPPEALTTTNTPVAMPAATSSTVSRPRRR